MLQIFWYVKLCHPVINKQLRNSVLNLGNTNDTETENKILFGHQSGTRTWSSVMVDVYRQRTEELFAQHLHTLIVFQILVNLLS